MEKTLIEDAKKNIIDILSEAFHHTDQQACVIVFDPRSELSQILTTAYRSTVPNAVLSILTKQPLKIF